MKQTFGHLFSQSVFCWVNWVLERHGEAIINYSGNLTKINTKYGDYSVYTCPYGQISYDTNISGAIVPSGVYVNGNFWPNNTNGMTISNLNGAVLFTGTQNGTINGSFTVHEVNVYPTTEKEEFVLFGQQFNPNPQTLPTATRTNLEYKTIPCIYIKTKAGDNTELCFDGMMDTEMTARLVYITDNQYVADGITSLFRDATHTYAPLLTPEQFPFDILGAVKTGWNYHFYQTGVSSNNLLYVDSVDILEYTEQINSLISTKAVAGIIDVNFSALRFPKLQK